MERIERVRVKIGRAKEHQVYLQAQVQAFIDSKPYRVANKYDPTTRRLIYYLDTVRDTPIRISSIAGDALQNLRSALDHLVYELFIKATAGTAGDGKHISFPIFDDSVKYAAGAPGKLNGVAATAIASIDALKPYKGGNDTLWQIHRLNNIDKHRFLVTVGSAFRSFDLGAHMQQMMVENFPQLAGVPQISAFFKPADRMFPLKSGAELFVDVPDKQPNPKMQFRFEIAFGEAGIIEGEPLLETLQKMIDTVDKIVAGFESDLA